ncbi:hypothetical protein CVT24_011282 [Panaeolus cyanescens]|uniref:RRM domain-containing protein n=1 Tax=Panaeolus cyanescens TaxID=181874 RepID=A0A409YUV2_9AGAR|nr:hypothetical protein CVT24_011282 [Panaeolus cyanescens]
MAPLKPSQKKPYSRPGPRPNVNGQWLHDKAPTGPARGRIAPNPIRKAMALPPPGPAAMNNRLRVANLHYEVTPKDLMSIFGQIGTLVREPLLRYDERGRSTGVAIITFENATEATRAKKQFDGILAKGQPMSITFDSPPRAPRRATSAPSTASLLNRIEKPSLTERISKDDTATAIKAPSGPRAFVGGPARNRPPRSAPRAPKKHKTAEELDRELDAFMGDAEPTHVDDAPYEDVMMT